MNDLTFAQLREVNIARCAAVFHALDAWSPCDWATALAGECGEACNIVKKLRRLEGADSHMNTPEHRAELKMLLGKELADVVIYLDLLAARMDLDLGEEVTRKFNEVSVRRHCINEYSL